MGRSALSEHEIAAAVGSAEFYAGKGDVEAAQRALAPLLDAQAHHSPAAVALLGVVDRRVLPVDRGLELARSVFEAHADDDALLGIMGSALEGAHDLRFLNAPPASDPLFASVAERLRARLDSVSDDPTIEIALLGGLATAGRLLGRAWDADAERAYRRLVELRPGRWQDLYNMGLFFKVRARFAEGLDANQRAAALGGAEDDSVQWNLGICATGAGDGAAALAVWKGFGHTIELGRFGLPEGPYQAVKVRLAERPVASRSVDDETPGLEETIWIDRLSPCHGIVRSALYQDLGVDYGDVVLFDGAPITEHKYGEREVPVFPHLVTLRRCGYRILPFLGTQPSEGAIANLSRKLPRDSVLYSHTEQFVVMCATCWENQQVDHASHKGIEHHLVRGKLCAPPDIAARDLLVALDGAVAESPDVRVYVPELARLAGDDARADVEARRMAMAVANDD
jgi:hypothetical protein